ncbi:stigma-specific STIG1-like protein 1 [Ricinus communis]|uniref:stigma-specific STIG1-like protein 1 n=1 Tax=Ricinus communis TaxID=3988 RepID=UPI00201B3007|nr:stigma-specific STIG1-like protein 1 [Ricinus communis]
MELMKIIFFIAITMALSITLTVRSIGEIEDKPPLPVDDSSTFSKGSAVHDEENNLMPSKRLSRFLAEDKNPRAADHCRKDQDVCYYMGGKNYTCCNNKCLDLSTDDKNCGACKKKCLHTQTCCRGQCVYLSLDKRHCGKCNNRCLDGEYCVFGMCSYA